VNRATQGGDEIGGRRLRMPSASRADSDIDFSFASIADGDGSYSASNFVMPCGTVLAPTAIGRVE
jgi:hypothetical protein